ncbi:hypothetical protein PIB30_039167 [Stylosanthes scabra]|uniref:Peptidase S8/S53 domain-containing protein n=1 Tax=Stylosanthes scabra TaxID=79078 RepID=A0ABU6WCS3_9FABA|nr:hypothetical protein [Stylosanthes scabra]
MFTVGASTIDRDFANYVALGDKKHLMIGSLDPKKTKGKILVCLLDEIDGLVYAEEEALSKGIIGLILANNKQRGNDIIAFAHLLPTTNINYTDGEYVYSYIRATTNPKACMSSAKTEVGVKPAPLIASLSSRGPNLIQPSILKPDVIAPGVDISGTSISSPHVAAIAALLKILYPDWTPAAIKSAIMTTATTMEENMPLLDQSKQEATSFTYRAGHMEPELAADPGLVYDLTIDDYLNCLCAHHDFNYPSIVVPNLGKHLVEVSRTVTNVGSPGIYWVYVKESYGVSVLVKPKYLELTKLVKRRHLR